MNQELIELVEQLTEFGYGDSLRLDSISKRLRNEQPLYPSDQKYVDMLVSKYLYPHEQEEAEKIRKAGSLENKIQNVKQRYGGEVSSSTASNLSDLCPKCGSPVPRMFSFCSICGAFHDEHNFINTSNTQQKKENRETRYQQSSQDASMKPCITCNSKIFKTHEFCPICGVYQGKNKLKNIKKSQSKQKKYTGMAVAGIIFIILGVIPAISLFQYSSLCSSALGQFSQTLNLQIQGSCNYVQVLTSGGYIFFIIGIVLLVVRAVKRKRS
ncbi:MAG: hypothetical protein ACREBA_09695 [Nitrosotalea sp.]